MASGRKDEITRLFDAIASGLRACNVYENDIGWMAGMILRLIMWILRS